MFSTSFLVKYFWTAYTPPHQDPKGIGVSDLFSNPLFLPQPAVPTHVFISGSSLEANAHKIIFWSRRGISPQTIFKYHRPSYKQNMQEKACLTLLFSSKSPNVFFVSFISIIPSVLTYRQETLLKNQFLIISANQ